jgi:hypothetical protein
MPSPLSPSELASLLPDLPLENDPVTSNNNPTLGSSHFYFGGVRLVTLDALSLSCFMYSRSQ